MRKVMLAVVVAVSSMVLWSAAGMSASGQAKVRTPTWTESFNLEKCNFLSEGRNEYFVLEPGFQLVFQGPEGRDTLKLEITVLQETRKIGGVETRVVEERETIRGAVTEVSRNFYAICAQTNSVFYFGEEVDNYAHGKVSGHEGSWSAGSANSSAGLVMPGIILVGARFYQEKAPGIAMDRAEIVSMTETVTAPAGTFKNCLKTEETTAMNAAEKGYKYYAPGIGLVRDGNLLLTRYGQAGK